MQNPLQITMRDIEHSDAVEARIREKARKLEQFSDRIIGCRIVVEAEQMHRQSGKHYKLHLQVTLPAKKELIVNRNCQEDLYMTIRDAFDDMVRQLEETMRKLQGSVKTHPPLVQGAIVRLFADEQFGFITTAEGEELYFNADSVVHPNFERLKVGMSVNFIEKVGPQGPRACRVSAKDSGALAA